MANNKGTRKELIEINAELTALERARPYLVASYYYQRTEDLYAAKTKIEKKLNDGKLAPDLQFIIVEYEG